MSNKAAQAERAEIDAVVEGKTIIDYFNRNADEFGDQPAIHWRDGDWRRLTWAEYRDAVHKVAAGLQSLGVAEGEFVAIMAGNRPEHVIADLGAVHAGATPVTVYSTLQANEIKYIAQNCAAAVAILEDETFLSRWEEVRDELPDLRYVVLMSGASEGETADWVLSWDELAARGAERLEEDPETVARATEAINPDSLATLIYTSGTTGTPKGVMISQYNVVHTLEALRRVFDLSFGLRMVSYLPLAHIAERVATHYSCTYLVGQVWYCSNVTSILDYTQAAKPTVFFGVPRIYEKFHARLSARFAETGGVKGVLLKLALALGERRFLAEREGVRGPALAGLLDKIVLSKVREGLGMDEVGIAVTAAAPIHPELITFFNSVGINLVELYGMSENTGPATTNVPGRNKIGSVGPPLPGVEVRVADDGELQMRGGVVTQGYYKLDEMTREAYLSEGWLATGDLARIDDDGFVWIVGRKKEIIITAAGKNIAPAKLETMLGNHPLILKVCMVGDQRSFISMVVALDPEEAPGWAEARGLPYTDLASFAELPEVKREVADAIGEANGQVARVEQVKKWVVVPDEWAPESGEITPSLKLKRQVVLDKYAEEIDAMYADA